MVRECLRALVAIVCGSGIAGCSFVLDFSEGAIPKDAQPDSAFSQAECDFNEPNNTSAEAMMIDATVVGPAAICADGFDDTDFYKFTVPPSTASVTIRINFINSSRGDLDLRLFDLGGLMLGSSSGFVDNEQIVCPGASPECPFGSPTVPLAAADYIFEVFGRPGHANRYDITLMLTPM